jgi:hypothetical protein
MDVFAFRIASERDHVRVLTEQKHVGNSTGLPRDYQPALQLQCWAVANQPQVNGKTLVHFLSFPESGLEICQPCHSTAGSRQAFGLRH